MKALYPSSFRFRTLLAALLFGASSMVSVAADPEDCIAYAGTLAGFKPTDCLQDGGTAIGGIPIGDAVVPPGYQTRWVLTEGLAQVILEVRHVPIFDVYAEALYTVHTLVYDPATLDLSLITYGTTTLAGLEGLLIQGGGPICAALDMDGTNILVENPITGGIVAFKDQDCLEEGGTLIGALPLGGAHVPAGYSMIYLFSVAPDQVILGTSTAPYYTAPQVGVYGIHTLVYDPATLDLDDLMIGTTTIADLNAMLLQGGGGVCAALDVEGVHTAITDCPDEECLADAGTMAGFKPADCLADGGTAIGGIPIGDAVVPDGFIMRWLLVEHPGQVILEMRHVPIFDVFTEALYSIHTLVFDTLTLDPEAIAYGETTLEELEALLIQGGGTICAALDMAGTSILVENPVTGGIVAFKDEDCLEEGGTLIGALPLGGANVPEGYEMIFLFSHGDEQVILGSSSAPYYTAQDTGIYGIHILVYHPATLDLAGIVPGTTTIADLNAQLVQGGGGKCAALDVDGVHTHIKICPDEECLANAGTLDGEGGEFGCLQEDDEVVIVAFPNGDAVVPAGHQVLFLLTQDGNDVITASHTLPEFAVTEPGTYAIHTLVYDPLTFDSGSIVIGLSTLSELGSQFIGGDAALCGDLDLTGALFEVEECPDQCLAYAGTLSAMANPVCLENGAASIVAVPNGDAFVPPGYSTVYILSLGQDQVVLNVGVLPSFTVNAPGSFTIHRLVFQLTDYNPGSLELGSTTIAQLNALLIQGGGTICGSLDLVGAPVTVNDCGPGCVAYAGHMVAGQSQVCLLVGMAVVNATPVGNANVPPGYAMAHLLTSAGVILDVHTVPSFVVDAAGVYSIHAFVHDPATFDLGDIEPGVTTLASLHALLEQGGGDICASLDLAGAAIQVIDCSAACVADAGTLTAADDEVFIAGGSASFFAFLNGDMLVPPGYQVMHLLALNGTIVATAATPVFTVTDPGLYTIHTLVYDPTTFEPAGIVVGATTIAALDQMLVQGGGTICASLDLVGATVEVLECTDVCTVFAGTASPVNAEPCYAASGTVIAATHNGDAIKPTCFERIHFLSAGPDKVIINASVPATFVVDATGIYGIHALVFDPNTLDPNSVIFGVTTVAQLQALMIEGGGTICASIDLAGAVVEVVDCLAPAEAVSLTAWPSPTNHLLHLSVASDETMPFELSVWNMQGAQVMATVVLRNNERTVLDVKGLMPGQYILRLVNGDRVLVERFMKAD